MRRVVRALEDSRPFQREGGATRRRRILGVAVTVAAVATVRTAPVAADETARRAGILAQAKVAERAAAHIVDELLVIRGAGVEVERKGDVRRAGTLAAHGEIGNRLLHFAWRAGPLESGGNGARAGRGHCQQQGAREDNETQEHGGFVPVSHVVQRRMERERDAQLKCSKLLHFSFTENL